MRRSYQVFTRPLFLRKASSIQFFSSFQQFRAVDVTILWGLLRKFWGLPLRRWVLFVVLMVEVGTPLKAFSSEVSEEEFKKAPGVLASWIRKDLPLDQIIDFILKDPLLSQIIGRRKLFVDRIYVHGKPEQIELIGGFLRARKAYLPGERPPHNIYQVAFNILKLSRHRFAMIVLSGSSFRSERNYDSSLILPNSLEIGNQTNNYWMLEPAAMRLSTDLLKMILFEEFFHLFEIEYRKTFGKFYIGQVNQWIRQKDLPAYVTEPNDQFLEWRRRHNLNIYPEAQMEVTPHFYWKDSVQKIVEITSPELKNFEKIPEFTVYLAMQTLFPEWFQNEEFREYFENNHPGDRRASSPWYRIFGVQHHSLKSP